MEEAIPGGIKSNTDREWLRFLTGKGRMLFHVFRYFAYGVLD